jgi:hypothetical protein
MSMTAFRVALAAVWIVAIVIGLRARVPAVRMNAPVGLIGLSTTALYFLRDSVDRSLLIGLVVIAFVVSGCWMLHLRSQQREWLKSRIAKGKAS